MPKNPPTPGARLLQDAGAFAKDDAAHLRRQFVAHESSIHLLSECVDHFIVLSEAHLRRILRAYAIYYNDIRTHRSLDKDAPVSRVVQRTGIISSRPILGGLHHHYVRV
jgi:hypothetical protein